MPIATGWALTLPGGVHLCVTFIFVIFLNNSQTFGCKFLLAKSAIFTFVFTQMIVPTLTKKNVKKVRFKNGPMKYITFVFKIVVSSYNRILELVSNTACDKYEA